MSTNEIAVKSPKTPEQKIAFLDARIKSDTEKRAEQVAILDARIALENISAGAPINFIYGRGENRKVHTGKVLAVAETDKGKRIKVQYGEGFDVDVAVIAPCDIVGASSEALASNATDPLAGIQ